MNTFRCETNIFHSFIKYTFVIAIISISGCKKPEGTVHGPSSGTTSTRSPVHRPIICKNSKNFNCVIIGYDSVDPDNTILFENMNLNNQKRKRFYSTNNSNRIHYIEISDKTDYFIAGYMGTAHGSDFTNVLFKFEGSGSIKVIAKYTEPKAYSAAISLDGRHIAFAEVGKVLIYSFPDLIKEKEIDYESRSLSLAPTVIKWRDQDTLVLGCTDASSPPEKRAGVIMVVSLSKSHTIFECNSKIEFFKDIKIVGKNIHAIGLRVSDTTGKIKNGSYYHAVLQDESQVDKYLHNRYATCMVNQNDDIYISFDDGTIQKYNHRENKIYSIRPKHKSIMWLVKQFVTSKKKQIKVLYYNQSSLTINTEQFKSKKND